MSSFVKWLVVLTLTGSMSLGLMGCRGGDGGSGSGDPDGGGGASTDDGAGSDTNKVVDEFPEGDPSVSAEDGGPDFTGDGWTTSTPGRIGSPDAVRGGFISMSIPNWPENLRRFGTGSNTWLNYSLADLCYEGLCGIHPNTAEFMPSLATHWQISEDNMTFRFRINPKARWSDGQPVVAEDWVATYRLLNDVTLLEPMMQQSICGMMEEPVAVSKYILEVKCKEKSWKNFLFISGLTVLPSHEIGEMTGKEFLDTYNFNFTSTTGPYVVKPADIKKGESLVVTRRDDYWAEDEESTQGLFNFDKIRFVVVRESRLAFDKACKGEVDFHTVTTAKWWVEDVKPLDAYKNGQLIRKEIFTKFPKGISGMAFNMRKPPVDDVRVRQALSHLYDRKTLLTKFAYDQYDRLKSYYPGGDGENPENMMSEYDPEKAIALLEEAGWKERDQDGVLKKDGKRLTIELMYRTQGLEKYFTSFQEACKQVGVEVKMNLITPETHWKNMMERKFHVASMAWGAILYPNPRSNWHSEMADKEGSNNIVGFKNQKADALIKEYEDEFDVQKRNALLRKLDGLYAEQVPYMLGWYLPCERILYWNKFGMPEWGLPRYGEYEDAFVYWWYDADKAAKLKETLKSNSEMAPVPKLQVRPWEDN